MPINTKAEHLFHNLQIKIDDIVHQISRDHWRNMSTYYRYNWKKLKGIEKTVNDILKYNNTNY